MSEPARFRKKPVVITAMRWQPVTKEAIADMLRWVGSRALLGLLPGDGTGHVLTIKTLEGIMEASPGDWVICGVQGEFYPCKPDIFEATYEPATQETGSELETRAGKAERELKAAQIVIGAAALSAGGFLRISRKAMTEVDHHGELSAWSEPDEIVYTYHARQHD